MTILSRITRERGVREGARRQERGDRKGMTGFRPKLSSIFTSLVPAGPSPFSNQRDLTMASASPARHIRFFHVSPIP